MTYWQRGFLKQTPGHQQPPRLGQSDGAGTHVLPYYPAKVTCGDAKGGGQGFQLFAVRQGPGFQGPDRYSGHGGSRIDGSIAWGEPGPTKQAGPEASLFSGSRVGEKAAIFRLGAAGAADGAAVNSRGGDSEKKDPIKARITGGDGEVADSGIQEGHPPLYHITTNLLAVFGHSVFLRFPEYHWIL